MTWDYHTEVLTHAKSLFKNRRPSRRCRRLMMGEWGYSTLPRVIAGSSFHNSDCRSMPSDDLSNKYTANSLLNIPIC